MLIAKNLLTREASYKAFGTDRDRVDGFVPADGAEDFTNRDLIVQLAARHRLPAIYPGREFVEVGGLLGYGVDNVDAWRRIADMTDQVLRGAKPGDIPFYQQTKFELPQSNNCKIAWTGISSIVAGRRRPGDRMTDALAALHKSAAGPKRRSRGAWRFRRCQGVCRHFANCPKTTLVTLSGHGPDRNSAVQQRPRDVLSIGPEAAQCDSTRGLDLERVRFGRRTKNLPIGQGNRRRRVCGGMNAGVCWPLVVLLW